LGRVVATAAMGKAGSNDGDTLDAPTTKLTYVADAFAANGTPNYVKAEARETHGDPQSRWQVAYTYSDGLGRVAMTKVQAEPGLAPARDASGQLVHDNDGKLIQTWAATRWVGTGRTVFDNKGQPVKQYEPYFSSVPAFEDETELVEQGVTPILRYDPLSRDALGRTCAESTYSTGGQSIRSSHIDSGEGFAFTDVRGTPLYAWDTAGQRVRTEFDALRRPSHVWVKKGNDPEWLSQRMIYGEAAANPEDSNLRGKTLLHFDGAGLAVTDSYDFKGNLLSSKRRLATTYDAEPSWTALAGLTVTSDLLSAASALLEGETFATSTAYDALNRPTSMTQPDSSVILPSYNEAGLLDGVDVKIRDASTATTFVENIDYDSKGRRERIEYGNGTATAYDYDPLTYRLTRLKTTRASDSTILQNLFYTYDSAGNIVAIADTAHQTVFFAGQQVTPSAEYEYDALYRLVKANGREHAGGLGDDQRDHNDLPLWNLPHPNDAQALRRYEERYEYDLVGNLLKMIHQAIGSAVGSWTRRYAYGSNPFPAPPQQPLPVPENNRLRFTSLPGDPASGPFSASYTHDENGNMTSMPHLANIAYTHANQMREADLGGGGTAYYTYDAGGERVRKVIQRLGTTREERIYLGGWELYRKRQGASQEIVLERETLHVVDGARRIAMVETKTADADVPGPLTVSSRLRYQLDNHLGTATLEVDGDGLVISYEEFHPYGASAYRSARSGVEVSEKRYRYTGRERDEETGLNYHSARYYATWLARWTSTDPIGAVDGPSLYVHARDNPVILRDPSGLQSKGPTRTPEYDYRVGDATVETGFTADLRPIEQMVFGEDEIKARPSTPKALVEPPMTPQQAEKFYAEIETEIEIEDWLGAEDEEPSDSHAGEIALGIAYGTLQAYTPFGCLAPSPAPQSRDFEIARGGAQLVTGIVQIVGGIGMIIGGGGGAIGGVAGAPFTGGASLLVTVLAGGAVAAGWAAVAQGAMNVIAGSNTLANAPAMSTGSGESPSPTGKWHKGSYDSPEASLQKHFEKHGAEVGAGTKEEYLQKAESFLKRLDKARAIRSPVRGATPGITRYRQGRYYIDITPDGKIISFGASE
jgi:RHS repeat-associated protein